MNLMILFLVLQEIYIYMHILYLDGYCCNLLAIAFPCHFIWFRACLEGLKIIVLKEILSDSCQTYGKIKDIEAEDVQ